MRDGDGSKAFKITYIDEETPERRLNATEDAGIGRGMSHLKALGTLEDWPQAVGFITTIQSIATKS